MPKLHMYEANDVTRSVLNNVPITANCGLVKTLTREDIDKVVGSTRQACQGCLAEFGRQARLHGAIIRKAEGWLKHVEIAAREPSVRHYKVRLEPVARWDFPLGA